MPISSYFTNMAEIPGSLRQVLATLAVCLTAAQVASVWSFTATALPSLRLANEFQGLTQFAEDWIGGSQFVGALLASLVGGYVSQKKGHRVAMLFFIPFLLMGWILVIFAQNLTMIIIGRVICGFSAAAAAVPPPTFIAEISHNQIRGKLVFYYDLFFCIGVLYINIFGAFLSWRFQAVCCAALPILSFIAIFPLNESPRKILEVCIDNVEEAKRSMLFYRNTQNYEDIAKEYLIVESNVREIGDRHNLPESNVWNRYMNSETLRPLLICIILQFYLQMSGEIPIVGYTVDIFSATGTWFVNEYFATIIVGTTNLIMTIVASEAVDNCGRRFLMMGSQLFCGLSLGILAVYMYLKSIAKEGSAEYDILSFQLSWIPMLSLVLFMTAFSFGVGPMPWLIMGEVVPESARGYATGVTNVSNRFIGFFPMFFFKDITFLIGQHGAFTIFALINFSGVFYVYFCVPETTGRDLTEISRDFENRNNRINPNEIELI